MEFFLSAVVKTNTRLKLATNSIFISVFSMSPMVAMAHVLAIMQHPGKIRDINSTGGVVNSTNPFFSLAKLLSRFTFSTVSIEHEKLDIKLIVHAYRSLFIKI